MRHTKLARNTPEFEQNTYLERVGARLGVTAPRVAVVLGAMFIVLGLLEHAGIVPGDGDSVLVGGIWLFLAANIKKSRVINELRAEIRWLHHKSLLDLAKGMSATLKDDEKYGQRDEKRRKS